MEKSKNVLKKLLPRLTGVILFIYIVSKIEWKQFANLIKEINLVYLCLGLGLLIPIVITRTLKWKIITNALGVNIAFLDLMKILMRGIFLGFITPGKIGDFYRSKYLTDISNAPLSKTFLSVFFDRVSNLIALIFFALSGGIILISIFDLENLFILSLILGASIFLIFLILGCSYFLKGHFSKKIKQFSKELLFRLLPLTWKRKAEYFFKELSLNIKKLKPILLFKLAFYELIYYLFLVLVHFFLFLSLGSFIPFWYFLIILAIVVLVNSLPITIAGIGTREASFFLFLSPWGVSLSEAILFSLLILGWSIIIAFLGLIYFLKK